MPRVLMLVLLLIVSLWMPGCKKDEEPLTLAEQNSEFDKYIKKKGYQGVIQTASGLRYVVTRQGDGIHPKPNMVVTVHYEGTLLSGKKFDSSYDRGQPFEFTLGVKEVIQGWDEGVALLNTGSEAILFVPSNLAYGAGGAGKEIGPHTPLIFKIELLNARK